MQPSELEAFEEDIAREFNAGKIRAPVHLYDGCAEKMIASLAGMQPVDWIFCTWRSHYQALLKGVPAAELKAEIMKGRSISLCFPKHRIVSSAIVAGVLPIAVGTAMAVKRRGGIERVFVYSGEMTALTGMFAECVRYATLHDLRMTFVVEDNGKSVCTDTREVWGLPPAEESHFGRSLLCHVYQSPKIYQYSYQTKWPHAGAGQRVQF